MRRRQIRERAFSEERQNAFNNGFVFVVDYKLLIKLGHIEKTYLGKDHTVGMAIYLYVFVEHVNV